MKLIQSLLLCALISGCSAQNFTTNPPGIVGNPFQFTTNAPGRYYTVTTNFVGVWVTNSDDYLNGLYVPTNVADPADLQLSPFATSIFVSTANPAARLAQSMQVPHAWFVGTNQPLMPNWGEQQYEVAIRPGVEPYPDSGLTWNSYAGFAHSPTVVPLLEYQTNYSAFPFTTNAPGIRQHSDN